MGKQADVGRMLDDVKEHPSGVLRHVERAAHSARIGCTAMNDTHAEHRRTKRTPVALDPLQLLRPQRKEVVSISARATEYQRDPPRWFMRRIDKNKLTYTSAPVAN